FSCIPWRFGSAWAACKEHSPGSELAGTTDTRDSSPYASPRRAWLCHCPEIAAELHQKRILHLQGLLHYRELLLIRIARISLKQTGAFLSGSAFRFRPTGSASRSSCCRNAPAAHERSGS